MVGVDWLNKHWTLATEYLKPCDLHEQKLKPQYGKYEHHRKAVVFAKFLDTWQVWLAFDIVNKCRRLLVTMEVFLGKEGCLVY